MELLLVPAESFGPTSEVEVVLERDYQIDVVLLEDSAGRTLLPAFTSEQTLLRWKPGGAPWVAIPGSVALKLLVESDWHGLVVDVAGPHQVLITRDIATELLT